MNNFFSTIDQAIDFFKQLDKQDYVLCGTLALMSVGSSVERASYPRLLMDKEEGNALHLYGVVGYYYTNDLKLDKYCKKIEGTTVYLPIVERVIVECIKHDMIFIDEGVFCDSLERYQNGDSFNYELLLEVGAEFGVDSDTIDYWLEETEGFNNY